MTKHTLHYPIEINGSTLSSVTIRRPKGGDMVVIGDDVAHLMRFYSSNAKAAQEINNAQIAAELAGSEPDFEKIAANMTPPDSRVFSAMVAIVGRLTGIGEAAEELDVADLQDIAAKALNTGEAPGRGAATNGDKQ
ncbi:phage tail assembly protein [Brucella tritici]|uniref:Phage tail assembly protein n=1 Tax=Brucella tritici TaxID=94626 RepID=A0A6L3YW32_9HYPH|nr:phage tail assembly protein [Brucella tritici]KAB2689646.1 phage tail assembly protein [Brucella tritici]